MILAVFATTVAGWHDFYALVGGGAATLLGLLFVAVSLNLTLFTDPAHPKLQADAAAIFSSFLYLVLVALLFLVPDLTASGLGWPLLSFSLVELVAVQRAAGRVRRMFRTGLGGYVLELTPTLCYLAVGGMSLAALRGDSGWVTSGWMVGSALALLGTATGNAWGLLLQVGKAAQANPTP